MTDVPDDDLLVANQRLMTAFQAWGIATITVAED